ncbi:MFS transporter [Deminuibacter soli]|uniref:MFS transporter n=1 Tax=Deminuibacter soli TaxID=2291815 RepID=A0A3E1NHA8_9BACT|nr:MFS transporter [Deminuibacter soli]RFM27241.1 MFS transporter [Deminuibacter soli]
MTATNHTKTFTRYQAFMIAMLAIIQFTVILDFMVMAPLGANLMRVMKITPSQFSFVVSAYAFSAGISGICAAGFADRFDRKKMLLFFYTGFVVGTFLCGIAPNYSFLLLARIVTGLFGGVMGSISMAIIADLFSLQVRGRVMGFVQTSFAVSQVAGIPLGLFLASRYGWHSPFLLIVGFCVVVGIILFRWMKPVTSHLAVQHDRNAFAHLAHTASNKKYQLAFLTTVFMSAGGFMIMPFSSAFMVHNVGIPEDKLMLIFFVTGLAGLAIGPLVGKWSDAVGKYKTFLFGTSLGLIMMPIFTNLTITPMWIVMVINVITFVSISSRMIPSQALISGIPDMSDRGAFMSINSSIQQMGGGIATIIGGSIITELPNGALQHFNIVGICTMVALVTCAVCMYFVNRFINARKAAAVAAPAQEPAVAMGHE